ncbi:pentapeptide repeat-containing protein [Streptantibioticus ferralitis]|uniref:Pentapeptide repeat-containing protein n=1 Tax=Streptantibioticus ferralitis TaxID=236510 RepID=A0ABT5YSP5_9ACTN|nr:pentapeptide repeat-containing protein [Streptantibioticus ferralitis]MDF2254525.1 pentapeptide repeat-containing protein [Streptantibioticus ferralitis]
MNVPGELSHLPYADLLQPHAGGLAARQRYDTVHFDGLTLEEERADDAQFLECAVTECAITGGSLRAARFNEVWIQGTRLVGTGCAETNWLDSTADSCVLAGVEAFGAQLRRVSFRRCKFDSVNLRSAALHEVVFEDCVLRDVDLGGARLADVSFPGSALERLRLGRAALKRVDLRGASLLDLADGYEALSGAMINSSQLVQLAPGLAGALGIVVEDR